MAYENLKHHQRYTWQKPAKLLVHQLSKQNIILKQVQKSLQWLPKTNRQKCKWILTLSLLPQPSDGASHSYSTGSTVKKNTQEQKHSINNYKQENKPSGKTDLRKILTSKCKHHQLSLFHNLCSPKYQQPSS